MHNVVYSFKNSKRVEKRYKVEYGNPVSPGETMVAAALYKLKIAFHTEVYFPNFKTPKGGYYRYDFLLYNQGTILEYDGVHFHKNRKANDDVKTKYCRTNSIPLYRFSGSDFYNMEQRILDVLGPNYLVKEKSAGKPVTRTAITAIRNSLVPVMKKNNCRIML